MRKIRLDLNDLEVKSFEPMPQGPASRQGTVHAYACAVCCCNPCCCNPCQQGGDTCCPTCAYTCDDPSCAGTCYPEETCTPHCALETIRTCPI